MTFAVDVNVDVLGRFTPLGGTTVCWYASHTVRHMPVFSFIRVFLLPPEHDDGRCRIFFLYGYGC